MRECVGTSATDPDGKLTKGSKQNGGNILDERLVVCGTDSNKSSEEHSLLLKMFEGKSHPAMGWGRGGGGISGHLLQKKSG